MLTELANSGDDFVKSFHVFLTYPFVDEVVGRDPQVARNLHMGDYTNLSIELDLDLERRHGGSTASRPACCRCHRPRRRSLDDVPGACASGDLTSASRAARLLPNARDACLELPRGAADEAWNEDTALCKQLRRRIPGLPPDRAATIDDLLGGVARRPRSRPAPGRRRARRPARQASGPTLGELMQTTTRRWSRLLVPGMVVPR